MGLKNKIASVVQGFGEETIKVVDYDEKKSKTLPKPRIRKPKTRKIMPRITAPKVEPIIAEKDEGTTDSSDSNTSETASSIPENTENTMVDDVKSDDASAFAIDDDYHYSQTQSNTHDKHSEVHTTEDNLKLVDENAIKDVLEVLQIPATFEIDNDVFLPEDLVGIQFDLQVPQGYEMGQVDSFVSQVKTTVSKLVELLKLRNEHIAKLATTVDRLQVDAHNLRYEAEIANGINIMPTANHDELTLENERLRILVQSLKEQNQSKDDGLSSQERQKFESLQDEFSVLSIENQELHDEVYQLKSNLAALQERLEDPDTLPPVQNVDDGYMNNAETDEESLFTASDDEPLPSFSGIGLPHQPFNNKTNDEAHVSNSSKNTNNGQNMSTVEIIDEPKTSQHITFLNGQDEDSDDELDLLQEWNQN